LHLSIAVETGRTISFAGRKRGGRDRSQNSSDGRLMRLAWVIPSNKAHTIGLTKIGEMWYQEERYSALQPFECLDYIAVFVPYICLQWHFTRKCMRGTGETRVVRSEGHFHHIQ
jgi:hypothetical protein